jgi:hypothetical protein
VVVVATVELQMDSSCLLSEFKTLLISMQATTTAISKVITVIIPIAIILKVFTARLGFVLISIAVVVDCWFSS